MMLIEPNTKYVKSPSMIALRAIESLALRATHEITAIAITALPKFWAVCWCAKPADTPKDDITIAGAK